MILFNVVSGSRLYGTATETSDYDYMSAYLPTDNKELFCLGSNYREASVTQKDGNDIKSFDVRHFVNLAMKGQTTFIESFFVALEHRTLDPCFYDCFMKIACKLPTSQANLVCPAVGYAEAEKKTAFGETTGNLGAQRKLQIEEFGYSPKNAHHGIRIMGQALHCLKTGSFSPYVRDHCEVFGPGWLKFLRDTKRGAIDGQEVRETYDKLLAELYLYHAKRGDEVRKSWLHEVDPHKRRAEIYTELGEFMRHYV